MLAAPTDTATLAPLPTAATAPCTVVPTAATVPVPTVDTEATAAGTELPSPRKQFPDPSFPITCSRSLVSDNLLVVGSFSSVLEVVELALVEFAQFERSSAFLLGVLAGTATDTLPPTLATLDPGTELAKLLAMLAMLDMLDSLRKTTPDPCCPYKLVPEVANPTTCLGRSLALGFCLKYC